MKKILLPILLCTASSSAIADGLPVVDFVQNWITITNQIENLKRFNLMVDHLEMAKDWIGNAAIIKEIAGTANTLVSLEKKVAGLSRTEIVHEAASALGLTYTDGGLYQAIGETFISLDGKEITRPDVFKTEAAIFGAIAAHDAVHEDVTQRRETLRTAIRDTLTQLQAGTNLVEVQKASGTLLAQSAELQALGHELTFAAQRAILLDIQNRAAKDRDEKAQRQVDGQEFQEALQLFGNALRPPTFQKSTTP